MEILLTLLTLGGGLLLSIVVGLIGIYYIFAKSGRKSNQNRRKKYFLKDQKEVK